MRRLQTLVLVSCLAALLASGASAWKPTTHLYLAEVALGDIKNGRLSIDLLDTSGRKIGTLGPYRVDAALTQRASSLHRDQYMAGVVGPDAYPDMMTGQMNIHPPVAGSVHGSEFGTDAFLTHLWKTMEKERSNKTLKRSFVLGYLTHAAGDMFAHTLVNHYTDGAFNVGPNAARHMVMESYIGKRAKKNNYVPKIERNVESFIVRALARARPKSDLKDRLMRTPRDAKPQTKVLLEHLPPRYYSRLRNLLDSQIKRYDKLPPLHPERADFGVLQNYRKAWRSNIDTGLAEWVKLSNQLGRRLMWGSKEDFTNAKLDAERYARLHFAAMNGAPKELGVAAQGVVSAKNQILRAIGVKAVEDAVKELAVGTLDHVVEATTGHSLATYQKYVTHPGQEFDPLFQKGPKPTTLKTFNSNELKVRQTGMTGDSWDWRKVPAAYNTVTMTKLLFLTKPEVDRFLSDLAKRVDPREGRRLNQAKAKAKQPRARRSRKQPARTTTKKTTTATRKKTTTAARKKTTTATRKKTSNPFSLPGTFKFRGDEDEGEPAVDAPGESPAEDLPELTLDEAEAILAEVDAELDAAGLGDDAGEEIIPRGAEPQELSEHDLEEQLDPWDELVEAIPQPDDELDLPEEIQVRAVEAELAQEALVLERAVGSRYAPKLTKPNIMLGFLQSIDSSNQFMANIDPGDNDRPEGGCKADNKRMVLARHSQYFFGVLKGQTGLKRSCLKSIQLMARAKRR